MTRKKSKAIPYGDYLKEAVGIKNHQLVINAGTEARRVAKAMKKKIITAGLGHLVDVSSKKSKIRLTFKGETEEEDGDNYNDIRNALVGRKQFTKISYEDYLKETMCIKNHQLVIEAGLESVRMVRGMRYKIEHTALSQLVDVSYQGSEITLIFKGETEEDDQHYYKDFRNTVLSKKISTETSSEQPVLQSMPFVAPEIPLPKQNITKEIVASEDAMLNAASNEGSLTNYSRYKSLTLFRQQEDSDLATLKEVFDKRIDGFDLNLFDSSSSEGEDNNRLFSGKSNKRPREDDRTPGTKRIKLTNSSEG